MYSEQNEASKKYDYYLIVNMGGEVDCDVHFNIQSDDEDDPDWVVTDLTHSQLFLKCLHKLLYLS